MDDFKYNEGNNNANEQWANVYEQHSGKVVERINLNELTHVTVPGCRHLNKSEPIPADDFDDGIVAVRCLDCPISWAIKSTEQIS